MALTIERVSEEKYCLFVRPERISKVENRICYCGWYGYEETKLPFTARETLTSFKSSEVSIFVN